MVVYCFHAAQMDRSHTQLQEAHLLIKPKRITTSRLDDDGDEDSGDSEHGKHKYTSHSVTFQCFFFIIIIIILLHMQRGYTLLNSVVLSSPHYC